MAAPRPGWRGFAGSLKRDWTRNGLTDAAAALTFYAVLALFPFILFTVAAASLILRIDQVQALGAALARDTPAALAPILLARFRELASRPRVGMLTFSAIAAIWSATAGVKSLVTALNSACGVPETRRAWRVYAMAFAFMLGSSVLVLLAAATALAAPLAASKLGASSGALAVWLRIGAASLMMIVWAALFYVLPDVRQTVRSIIPGSIAGVLVWLAATLVFSFYVSHFGSFGVVYGALGGIVILLIWMWLSSLALLLGAEINALLRRRADWRGGAALTHRGRSP
ncbi:MAG TPA: YihY/virulence factor BrkB family protein [Burkholderiales bacterium]